MSGCSISLGTAAQSYMSSADAPILERLARLETQFEAGSPRKGDAAEGGEKKKTEDGEPDEDEPIEEDEDDYQEEDDYYQVSMALKWCQALPACVA